MVGNILCKMMTVHDMEFVFCLKYVDYCSVCLENVAGRVLC